MKIRASQRRAMAKVGGWRIKNALRATGHLDAVLTSTDVSAERARRIRVERLPAGR